MTEKPWKSRGTVVLDGETYHIRDLLDSDCYAPGTRFVSLALVEVDYEEPEEVFGMDYEEDVWEDYDWYPEEESW